MPCIGWDISSDREIKHLSKRLNSLADEIDNLTYDKESESMEYLDLREELDMTHPALSHFPDLCKRIKESRKSLTEINRRIEKLSLESQSLEQDFFYLTN